MDRHIERLHQIFGFDHRLFVLRMVDITRVLCPQLQTQITVGMLHNECRQMNMIDVAEGRQHLYCPHRCAHYQADTQGKGFAVIN